MRLLVALATTRNSEEMGSQAVEEARRRGVGLTLLLVTERHELERVHQLRSHPALQGTRALEDVLREIELEHRRMMEEQALRIEALALEAGLDVEKRLAMGDYEAEVAAETRRNAYAAVLWLRQNRGFIARFFLGDDAVEVACAEPDPGGVYSPGAFPGGETG